jgi:hypothetical protein
MRLDKIEERKKKRERKAANKNSSKIVKSHLPECISPRFPLHSAVP